jgi:hypothetical protein
VPCQEARPVAESAERLYGLGWDTRNTGPTPDAGTIRMHPPGHDPPAPDDGPLPGAPHDGGPADDDPDQPTSTSEHRWAASARAILR